jgi:hypothetical protein
MAAVATTGPCWDETRRDITFTLGLDLGQAADYTALGVLEKFTQPLREVDPATGDQKTETRYEIRHLSRYPLGTSYSDVVSNVAQLMKSKELLQWIKVKDRDGHRVPHLIKPALLVDATGIGRPVVDEFKKAGLSPIGVSIHGGEKVSRDYERGVCFWNVPKRDLVGQLQVAFQNRTLKIAHSLPLAGVLAEELRTFTRKINLKTAHESFEHWRDSQHDDLVLAASLAYWHAEGRHKSTGGKIPLKGF